ncbi:MAG: MBL fold metallo-hydrolase [Ignavibacteriaceae bacterium]|jgi:glyoxylase-like metal-dependent hydrolase (beta-lactamase superfamily II)|nr:MBL fold metallo-hydrolase [Ignavibacteriaceae bacterium]
MQIGKYKLHKIDTGTFKLDGGAMFGIIPKPLWERTNSSDESNRTVLAARCLLLESDSKKILIDTGVGTGWDDKFKKIYDYENETGMLEKSLSSLNISPDEITDVILTHLHFDHTGGSTKLENDKWTPAFSNAKYHVQKKHFEWALNPSDRDRGSFHLNRFMPLYEEGVLNLIDGQQHFDDEIEFMIIDGHTIAQQMVKISDSSETLVYCGDLLPFASHIHLPFIMGYDIQPLKTVEEKKTLYKDAVKDEWKIYFEHDENVPIGTINQTEKGFSLDKRIDLI